jgi:hypothetical protein
LKAKGFEVITEEVIGGPHVNGTKGKREINKREKGEKGK